MAKRTRNKDEIQEAFTAEIKEHESVSVDVLAIADGAIARLTAPTLRPDQPVMYDDDRLSQGFSACLYARVPPSITTNVRALFAEDEVMGMVALAWARGWWNSEKHNQGWWQAQLDAIKYGGE